MSTPILYIGGASRSGSTLLESLLAGLTGCVAIGEAVFIWERALQRNDRCPCGARFRECPFWGEVGTAAFGGWDQVPLNEAIRLRRVVDRHRNLHRLGVMDPGPLEPELAAYVELTEQLYGAIASVTGASVIVDSSKHAAYTLVLSRMSGFDLRLVHLVREPHGVAYSWARTVRRPGVGDGTGHISTHSTSWTVKRWIADNLIFESLRHKFASTLVRYEDVVSSPIGELSRLCTAVGLPELAVSAADMDASALPVPLSHAISGNPRRPGGGTLRVEADEEWRRAMSPLRRATVTAVTWPLLLRYSYGDVLRGSRP